MATTTEMLTTVIDNLVKQLPELGALTLTFGVDIRAKGDIQTYRVTVPGPDVSKGRGEDERCRVEIDRAQFNELAGPDVRLGTFRKVVKNGHIRFQGDPKVAEVITRVYEHYEQLERLKKV